MSSNLKTPKSHDKELNTTKWGIIGAIGAAVAASVCCVVPLVLVFLGIGGAWAGSLSAFEPFRPYLMILTAILLGFAFYRVYRHPAESAICEPGSACAKPGTDKRNKMFLWFATVGAVLLLGFPYAAPAIFAVHEDVSTVQQLEVANFDVTGMTCNS
ncbi:MAG TPA: hypothetical protein ENH10_06565 [Bacteroidetes bacterium]|nr:hypothetical protein [Bacteroidota bacterium]HEX04805.1 hypothetical protein [Bacteroidota bacterium]